MSRLRRELRKVVKLMHIPDGGLGTICNFSKKKQTILTHLDQISYLFREIWKNIIAKIWKPVEELNYPAPSSFSLTHKSSPKHF